MNNKILIIDDEEIIRLSLSEGLKDLGYKVSTAHDGKIAIEEVKKFKPQVVFLDMRLSNENGLDILPNIKEIDNEIEIVIMTAYGDIQTAVKAIKIGAFDYINKPFDLQEIDIIIKRIIKNIELQKKVFILEKEKQSYVENIIGEHPLMLDVFNKIKILSNNDNVTVLIRGETGTGKELVALAIHNNSIRKNTNILNINCGSIPHQLIESELFGFEKNAFTGANNRKKGLLEIADGGTVFLDEIGELPLELQPKLLRFLEERKFKRVGGLDDIEVDIRVIAATNKDLEKAIKNKEFREDLYYRLNVVPIYIPPLRERGRDILILANNFLQEYNRRFNKNIKGFTKKSEKSLLSYNWSGNVRELKNVVERIVILSGGEYIDIGDLPYEFKRNIREDENILKFTNHECKNEVFYPGFSLEKEVEEMETYYLKLALKKCSNNYTKASEMLGISRFAFKRRIEKYFL
ncbi:two-component system response regulator AtoC [Sedimentibacter acidaminivorans]|uniref:Two-component system response regulator AtoC n=1 Tax=Sedimentibacter acidaminivorans TaxID=913099 RepID=A0ABS4GGQ8_9FIRM|nr:sigma-54 dependent transcriptional regulator [Sedimentibacter acidaminivorans]MBP1926807.1 two-component system response regulator AtoC [Sedimentibacter acidaminivorans]